MVRKERRDHYNKCSSTANLAAAVAVIMAIVLVAVSGTIVVIVTFGSYNGTSSTMLKSSTVVGTCARDSAVAGA